jgi:PAS domain-containing protein
MARQKRSSRRAENEKTPVKPARPVPSRAAARIAPSAVARTAPRLKGGFPVVGIGASAGGLEAMEELFHNMPADTGMAFVVVTHQHPGHTSMLPALLSKCSKMPVAEASDGVQLAPNHVYVGPPGALLSMMHGKLHLLEAAGDVLARLPIDHFFRSLADDQKERAICIVLSGTGTDGTLGLRTIKGESGMAMVQDVQSAKYAGMPSSAAATGLADYVLPPARMPAQLVAYVQGPYLKAPVPAPEIAAMPAEPIEKVLLLLRNRTGHDFSSYKSSTIRRRIERRMNVHQIGRPSDYARYLQENEHEIDILFQELLISVTSFFRDPAAFEALAAHLPSILLSRFAPAQEVLKTLGMKEREVQTVDGRWYLMRIMPYRTADNVIDGVVVTFVDIDHMKTMELGSRARGVYFQGIVETVREPLLILDSQLRVVSANRAFYSSFQTGAKQVDGEAIYDLGNGQWDIPALRTLLEEIIPRDSSFNDYRVEHEFPKIGHRVMLLNARRIPAQDDAPALVLLAIEDVTGAKAETRPE